MNQYSEKRLASVHPELARRVRQIVSDLAAQGLIFEVVQGLRTWAEQDALYAQGRTMPGRRVTNARAGHSNHNFGLAVDLCVFENGQPNWNAPEAQWQRMGVAAEKAGLEWGGRWKSLRDMPHVQLPGLSLAQCQQLYRQGGLPLVWERASALLHVAEAPAPAPPQVAPPVPAIPAHWPVSAPSFEPVKPILRPPQASSPTPQPASAKARPWLVGGGGLVALLGSAAQQLREWWQAQDAHTLTLWLGVAMVLIAGGLWLWEQRRGRR